MTRRDAITAHYARRWPGPAEIARLRQGPIHELPVDFAVLVLPRSRGVTAYATVGMSQPEDDERLELHLLARKREEGLVEIMTAIAHYHRTGARLGLGHTVSFGRPWLAGSACSHGLISLPYLDGPELEWLDEPLTRFLWLIPITERELAHKKAHGLESLEEALEAAGFDYLNPGRDSVV
jgi:hypothetical protein